MYLLTLLENALDDTATLSGESAAPALTGHHAG
jgi:hypothetical protein